MADENKDDNQIVELSPLDLYLIETRSLVCIGIGMVFGAAATAVGLIVSYLCR
jgi:hypothetical protein